MIVGYYLLVNLLFGALYALNPSSVANLPRGSLADGFFFSVETFATVGYGMMVPQTLYGHVVATVEIFIGLLSTALLTGLIFVRFSRPRPSVIFARYMTIAPYDGVPTLTARIGNRRASQINQVEARLTLIGLYRTQEGYEHWRSRDLELVRPRSQMLTLSWTVMHRIDERSPLFGLTTEDLERMEAQLILTFTGTDQTLVAPVHAMRAYDPPDLLWGHRFGDVVRMDDGGRMHIELARFDDVVAV